MEKNFLKNLNPSNTLSLLMIAAFVIGGFILVKKTGILKSKKERQAEAQAETDIVDTINEDQVKQKKTLSDEQITAMANAIRNAWGVFNDDESAIYGQFSKCNNIYDIYALVARYGTYKGRTLEEDLRSRLSNKEVEHINSILRTKSINFSF